MAHIAFISMSPLHLKIDIFASMNIYHACDDRYRRAAVLNTNLIRRENIQGISVDKEGHIEIDVEKYKGHIDEVLSFKGQVISPDEVMATSKQTIVKVPLKQREEFKDIPLPDSDLLKSIHYYTSKKLAKQKWNLDGQADESALLAVGMLVEKWANDLIDDNTAKLFIEKYDEEAAQQSESEEDDNREVSDESDGLEFAEIDSDSDAMSDE